MQVANELGIPPSILRKWLAVFLDVLRLRAPIVKCAESVIT